MINQFKVGCNFDFELINKVADLNEKYKGKAEVKEFFASPSSAAPMTARPDWRLPNISDKDFFNELILPYISILSIAL